MRRCWSEGTPPGDALTAAMAGTRRFGAFLSRDRSVRRTLAGSPAHQGIGVKPWTRGAPNQLHIVGLEAFRGFLEEHRGHAVQAVHAAPRSPRIPCGQVLRPPTIQPHAP